MSTGITIAAVPASAILDLRWRILRAGLAFDEARFEGDDEPGTRHFAALENGRVVGCVTILRRDWEGKPAWQLRGMAVEADRQKSGIGRMLVVAAEACAHEDGFSRLMWCNAREPAIPFYRRLGWETVGERFEVPTAGPHYKMTRRL